MDRKLLSNYRASANHRPTFLRTAPLPRDPVKAGRTVLFAAAIIGAAFVGYAVTLLLS